MNKKQDDVETALTNDYYFNGKNVIITGATGGIGS